jgi:hypothetical protein
MGIVVVFGMMLFGLVAATVWAVRAWRSPDRVLRYTGLAWAGVFLAGYLGWILCPLAAWGGMDWLPASFEWPLGLSDEAVRTADGGFVVPHKYAGRVQVYDAEGRFVRGWQTEAGGGSFRVLPREDGGVEVFTARGNRHHVYDAHGSLVSSGPSPSKDSYEQVPAKRERISVRVPWWGWTLVNPAIAWVAMLLGGVLAWGSGPQDGKPGGPRKGRSTAAPAHRT